MLYGKVFFCLFNVINAYPTLRQIHYYFFLIWDFFFNYSFAMIIKWPVLRHVWFIYLSYGAYIILAVSVFFICQGLVFILFSRTPDPDQFLCKCPYTFQELLTTFKQFKPITPTSLNLKVELKSRNTILSRSL